MSRASFFHILLPTHEKFPTQKTATNALFTAFKTKIISLKVIVNFNFREKTPKKRILCAFTYMYFNKVNSLNLII